MTVFKINGKELSCAIREPAISNKQLIEFVVTALNDKEEALKMGDKLLQVEGYTEYDVKEGDVMEDEFGRVYEIKAVSYTHLTLPTTPYV